MTQILIQKQQDLKALCKSIKRGDIIAIDLEFMRQTTFYPILCLIQINFNSQYFIIDVLAEDLNLKPFAKILKSRSITKILHSSFQDLEVIFGKFKLIPRATFDTQLMANFLGYNFNISYVSLVEDLFNSTISKEEQMSDWQKRPLSSSQIEYAINDVKYLPEIYQILKKRLEEQNKLNYFLAETKLVLKKNYNINKQNIFRKFSLTTKNAAYFTKLKSLILWRDKVAKEKNIPRSFILKDDILNEIAKNDPKNLKQLKEILDLQKAKRTNLGKDILAVLKKAKTNKKLKAKVLNNKLSEKQKTIYQKAQNLLQEKSSSYQIRPELIINQGDLKQIILKNLKLKKALFGWRYVVFGKELKKLINKK